MDSLHAIGFYVSAALSVAGGLSLAFLESRRRRGAALAVVGLGAAGTYASLSAGLAGAMALLCYAVIALLVARRDYRAIALPVDDRWRQVAGVGAALLLAVLAYSAYRGSFAHAPFYGGPIGTAAIGRLLFSHDALATEAITALVLAALVGAAVGWRRERSRDERPREQPERRK